MKPKTNCTDCDWGNEYDSDLEAGTAAMVHLEDRHDHSVEVTYSDGRTETTTLS